MIATDNAIYTYKVNDKNYMSTEKLITGLLIKSLLSTYEASELLFKNNFNLSVDEYIRDFDTIDLSVKQNEYDWCFYTVPKGHWWTTG